MERVQPFSTIIDLNDAKKKDIFVNLINTLSDSIKEYYNVTKI